MWTLLDKPQDCGLRNVVLSFADGNLPAHICKSGTGYVFMVGSGYVVRTGIGPMTYEQSTVWPMEVIEALADNSPRDVQSKPQSTNPPKAVTPKPKNNGKGNK